MVHCPICYYTRSMPANANHHYVMMQRQEKKRRGNLSARLRVCGCDKCVWVQRHTHTPSQRSHHPAQLRDLIMPPFRRSSIQKNMSGAEKGPVCLLFSGKKKYFFPVLFLPPTSRLDTCCHNLLSLTGRAYTLSLQQMSSLGGRSLNRIFHQRQSRN